MKRIKNFLVNSKRFLIEVVCEIEKFIKRFNLTNEFTNEFDSKQSDIFKFEIRLSKLSIIELYIDFNREFKLVICNLGIFFK